MFLAGWLVLLMSPLAHGSQLAILFLSRGLLGVGCGSAGVVLPLYLSEVAWEVRMPAIALILVCTGRTA